MKYPNNFFDSEEFRMQFRKLDFNKPEDLSLGKLFKQIVHLELLVYHVDNSLQSGLNSSAVDRENISTTIQQRVGELYEELDRREERYKNF
jgi:hypothetical protein